MWSQPCVFAAKMVLDETDEQVLEVLKEYESYSDALCTFLSLERMLEARLEGETETDDEGVDAEVAADVAAAVAAFRDALEVEIQAGMDVTRDMVEVRSILAADDREDDREDDPDGDTVLGRVEGPLASVLEATDSLGDLAQERYKTMANFVGAEEVWSKAREECEWDSAAYKEAFKAFKEAAKAVSAARVRIEKIKEDLVKGIERRVKVKCNLDKARSLLV